MSFDQQRCALAARLQQLYELAAQKNASAGQEAEAMRRQLEEVAAQRRDVQVRCRSAVRPCGTAVLHSVCA